MTIIHAESRLYLNLGAEDRKCEQKIRIKQALDLPESDCFKPSDLANLF